MTIKGILVVGRLEEEPYGFIKGKGIVSISNQKQDAGLNIGVAGISRGVFPFTKIIPIINEIGMDLESVRNDVSIASQYLDSSSTILNNQFFKDNEIISVINPQQSNIQVNWSCANNQDGRVLFKPYEKFGRLYSEYIKNLIKQKMSYKNLISFKGNDNKENLFQVNNMATFTQNIEKYNEDLRKYNGDFVKLEEYYTTNIDYLLKTKTLTTNFNYDFLLFLAKFKETFINEEFIISEEKDGNLIETTTTIKEAQIDLNKFIFLTNLFYTSALESKITKAYENIKEPIMYPAVDWTNCYYIDTQFNFIINGKITNFNSNSNNGVNKVNYSITISNRTTSNLMPTYLNDNNLVNTNKKVTKLTPDAPDIVEKEEKKIVDAGVKKPKPFTKKSITERVY